jgi:protein dithiol:quinone oxidoreductase
MNPPTTLKIRALFLAIAVFCIGLLAGAYYLQYGPQAQQPCPLCIMQRYAYILVAFFALCGAMLAGNNAMMRLCAALASISAAAGGYFVGWQLTKGDSMTSCGADPIGQFVNGLPMRDWWPDYFLATGGCADKYPPILGLSLPVWSAICFALLLVVALLLFFTRSAMTKTR